MGTGDDDMLVVVADMTSVCVPVSEVDKLPSSSA
jgi:hypothetical protein